MAGLAATVERMPRRLKADCKAGRAADMRTFGFLTMQIWAGFSFVCTTRCPDVTFAHPLSSVPVAASTVRPAMILMVLSSKSMLAVKRIFLKKSIVIPAESRFFLKKVLDTTEMMCYYKDNKREYNDKTSILLQYQKSTVDIIEGLRQVYGEYVLR